MDSWLLDPTGLVTRLLSVCARLEHAEELMRVLVAHGPMFLRGDVEAFMATNELAVLLSLHLESLEGVDVEAAYAAHGEVGPGATRHGERLMEAARGAPSSDFRETLRASGVTVAGLSAERAVQVGAPIYSLNIGRDFEF